MRNLLLLSSSKVSQSDYLERAIDPIASLLSNKVKQVLFIPFAGVIIDYDDYTNKVRQALASLPINIESIHLASNPEQAIKDADAIMVGGGNTFHLLHQLYQFDLIGTLREQVMAGKPYVGWSAGSNIASPTIQTTNDMPIVQPPSFHALHLIPFQLNPHFLDELPEGFNGERRSERLAEFLQVNPDSTVVGLPEGTGVQVEADKLSLVGDGEIVYFKNGQQMTLNPDQLPDLLAEPN